MFVKNCSNLKLKCFISYIIKQKKDDLGAQYVLRKQVLSCNDALRLHTVGDVAVLFKCLTCVTSTGSNNQVLDVDDTEMEI